VRTALGAKGKEKKMRNGYLKKVYFVRKSKYFGQGRLFPFAVHATPASNYVLEENLQ
jgi:hypothetical protein